MNGAILNAIAMSALLLVMLSSCGAAQDISNDTVTLTLEIKSEAVNETLPTPVTESLPEPQNPPTIDNPIGTAYVGGALIVVALAGLYTLRRMK